MSRTVGAGLALLASVAVASAVVVVRTHRPDAGAPEVHIVRLPDHGLQPQVTTDGRGTVHLVYAVGDSAASDVYYARRAPGAASFSPAIRVNSQPGSALATGQVRGPHLAVGLAGRVHVSWAGSRSALPRGPAGTTPMLYARTADDGTHFEPQRNVAQWSRNPDGGAVAADAKGDVYIAWHAGSPESSDEASRRLWLATSNDDGATFTRERAVSDPAVGACGCCGVAAVADPGGTIRLIFRSARQVIHRDAYLLTAPGPGLPFTGMLLQPWNIGACPMSTFALAPWRGGVLAAWETNRQVQFTTVAADGTRGPTIEAPGTADGRRYPAVAANNRGQLILVWTEGMSWQRGGRLAWQVFDRNGRTIGQTGGAADVPAWDFPAVYATPVGDFTILY